MSIKKSKCTCMMSKQAAKIKTWRWLGRKHFEAVCLWKSIALQGSMASKMCKNVQEQITTRYNAETHFAWDDIF